jgi:hypothetical protein
MEQLVPVDVCDRKPHAREILFMGNATKNYITFGKQCVKDALRQKQLNFLSMEAEGFKFATNGKTIL